MPAMTVPEPGADPEPAASRPPEPLPARTVAAVAVVVALLTVAALVALLWWVNLTSLTGAELTNARLGAIRIGLSIAVGGGGVFALFLAWRRQRSTEADHLQQERILEHQRQVAIDSRDDALERRITELYTKSAELLGSDKAPVRLAGIYALERLGQSNPDQRQSVINVFCAYLRTPGDLDDQESHVRSSVQGVLTNHLRTRSTRGMTAFWPGIELDLTGTTLLDFDFSWCAAQHATFDQAEFRGTTSFVGSRFESRVSFRKARFGDLATFDHAHLTWALFDGAQFDKDAQFDSTEFPSVAAFDRTRFAGLADVRRCQIQPSRLHQHHVRRCGVLPRGGFHRDDDLHRCSVRRQRRVRRRQVPRRRGLAGVVFANSAVFSDVEFLETATFRGTDFQGNALFGGSVFHRRADFTHVTFGRGANFAGVRFVDGVDVFSAHARLDVGERDVNRAWPKKWMLTEPEPPDNGKILNHEGIWGEVFDTTRFDSGEQ